MDETVIQAICKTGRMVQKQDSCPRSGTQHVDLSVPRETRKLCITVVSSQESWKYSQLHSQDATRHCSKLPDSHSFNPQNNPRRQMLYQPCFGQEAQRRGTCLGLHTDWQD